jgi:uncharacterized DUF497 family protein
MGAVYLTDSTQESEEGEQVGRITSVRKATAHERKAYEEGSF